MKMRVVTGALALGICAAACSGTGEAADGPVNPDAGGGGGGGVGGTATISGSADGKPFVQAGAAYWIGAPDSADTTVLFVFSNAVKCSEISAIGWDTRIANHTQVLEMKLQGTSIATYPVVSSLTPASGEATVNYTLSTQTGTPAEMVSSGGSVMLTAKQAGTSAAAAFSLTFGGGSLIGSLQAVYCAPGVEP